ncbi:MAG: NAD-dependent epimerase/dehydratase family protein, partial [Minisyncoccia bacterium]
IGSHLVDRLVKENYKVVVIDNLSTGKRENINPKAKFYQCDICSSKIAEIIKKEQPEVIFHLAAQINLRKSVENPVEDAKINILGFLNLLESFVRYSKKDVSKLKFIFTSTGGAFYGDAKIIPTPETYPAKPLSPYGNAKLAVENYLNYYHQVFNLPYIILRLANVYGPRQNPKGEAGVISIFCDKFLNNKRPIIYGNGKQTRDFIFVDDVINACILSLKSKKRGVYNIGTAKETDINTIFFLLQKLFKSKIKPIYQKAKEGEQQRSCLDYSLAKKELKWIPKFNLEKGLQETVKWYKNILK